MGRGSQTVRVKVEVPVNALSVEICDCSAGPELGVSTAQTILESLRVTHHQGQTALSALSNRGICGSLLSRRLSRSADDLALDGDAPSTIANAYFDILLLHPWQFSFDNIVIPLLREVDSRARPSVLRPEGVVDEMAVKARGDGGERSGERFLQHTEEWAEFVEKRSCQRHFVFGFVARVIGWEETISTSETYIPLRPRVPERDRKQRVSPLCQAVSCQATLLKNELVDHYVRLLMLFLAGSGWTRTLDTQVD
jgi:hypothetical protein